MQDDTQTDTSGAGELTTNEPPGYWFEIIDEDKAAATSDLSTPAFRRECRKPDGPKRVRLAPRRFGFFRFDIRDWLMSRREPVPPTQTRDLVAAARSANAMRAVLTTK